MNVLNGIINFVLFTDDTVTFKLRSKVSPANMAENKGIQDKCYHSETYLNKAKLNQHQQSTFSNIHLPFQHTEYSQLYTWVIILRVADLTLLSPNPASFILSFLSFSLDLFFPPLLCVFVILTSSISLSPLIMLEYSVHFPVRINLRTRNILNACIQ